MAMRFPTNPFEDVQPSEFNKSNKKHASEHFLDENFRRVGWFVYEPFTDTGIDRIIQKKICPAGHTNLDEDTREEQKCKECPKPLQKITRFVQIKTRELKTPQQQYLQNLGYEYFGYTLQSTDFRTDPRHVFALYSDNTTNNQQDVHLIPIADFLQFFIRNAPEGGSFFSPTSFREGDNKDNQLHHTPADTWVYHPRGRTTQGVSRITAEIPFNDWLNDAGLRRISDINIDNNFQQLQDQIVADKLQLFYNYRRGRSQVITAQIEQQIQAFLDIHRDPNFPNIVTAQRQATLNQMRQQTQQDPDLRDSINQYFIPFRELRNRL